MQLYKIIQYGSCVVGLTLFIYGVTTLPQPQTQLSTSANPQSSQQIQDAYTAMVTKSPQFIIAMAGLGAGMVGVMWIYVSQPTELPIAPVPVPVPVPAPRPPPQPVEFLEPEPRPILRQPHLTIIPLGEGPQELV